jgi:trimeric autotransporter adhesin
MSWKYEAWTLRFRRRGWTLIGMLLAVPGLLVCLTVAGFAQIVTTQVTDTIYRADGTAATGTILVSWPAFVNSAGQSIPGGSTSATIATGGLLSIALAPNAGATPMGTYYTAVYHLDDGTTSREYWVVPASQAPVHLDAIKSTVLPTSVAMQTVSRSYVDTAIAAAVAGHPLDQTNPYVLKSGDTMTGPLALAGDPTSPLQAADKQYVDTGIAGLTGGLAQKVSTLPQTTQTVAQPTGTDLQVNNLNGVEYASQYLAGRGDDGIALAVSSSDCASGCEVKAEQSYASAENYVPTDWNNQTHLEDARKGQRRDVFLNPESAVNPGLEAGEVIDVTSTRSARLCTSRQELRIPRPSDCRSTTRRSAEAPITFRRTSTAPFRTSRADTAP